MRTSVLIVAMSVAGLTEASQAAAAADAFGMQAQAVAPGVYAVPSGARDFPNPDNQGWNANLAFVVTGEGVLVIDTGSSEAIGAALQGTIGSVTQQPVRWIVNTHGHGDHWLGNAALAGPDTELISSTPVRDRIRGEARHWIELFDRMTAGATGESEVVLPSTLVDTRMVRQLGDQRVELIPSGGSHSPGDLVVWLPGPRVLIAGDVVYSNRAPSTFDADVRQWIAFLGELEALDPAVVIPGHGQVSDLTAITRLRSYLERLWTLVKEGFDAGMADFEVAAMVQERMGELRDAYPGFEDKIGRSVSEVYLQVEEEAF